MALLVRETYICKHRMWASAGCRFARLVQPLSLVPVPCMISVGVPQPCTLGILPSLAAAARRDLLQAAHCSPGMQHWPWAGQQHHILLPGPKSLLPRLGRGTRWQRDASLFLLYGLVGMGMRENPVACGWLPTCNRSW